VASIWGPEIGARFRVAIRVARIEETVGGAIRHQVRDASFLDHTEGVESLSTANEGGAKVKMSKEQGYNINKGERDEPFYRS
jgi:hypothetical protein